MAYINEFRNIVRDESKGYGNRFFFFESASCINQAVNAKRFKVIINKETDRVLSLTPLKLL